MIETSLEAGYIDFGGRIYLRPVEASDGLLVSKWRNERLSREMFYSQAVVTPDSHALWLETKDPYDLVWMVCQHEGMASIGMASLHIDPAGYTGEYGRVVISPVYRGQGYAKELDYTMMAVAFELFELDLLWLEAFTSNEGVLTVHDKTGFQRAGVDVEGHTHPRGPVQYMTMGRHRWAAIRPGFYAKAGQEMPEWTP